jgi:arylsulfatase A
MMNVYKIWVFFIALIFLIQQFGCNSDNQKTRKPNIILILIDDLGYGDLGCYGNITNITTNIDRLAKEGIRFTDFHSNGPMCTPTRAALLTGMYQNRLGEKFEGPLSGKTQYNEGMPLEVVTMAEMLKKTGYATGMFGKWHLGYKEPFLPTNQGFDEFRGLSAGDGDHHSHIDRWGREDWWHNNTLAMENGYSVDLITGHSKSFIENHKNEPFFLYMAHLAIHFPWQGPDDPPHRKKGDSYENDKWGIIEDRENVYPHVKAMVEAVDQSVGEIINTLKKLNLDEHTLVIFASDNGGYIHYNHQFNNISSNGPLRGQKAEVYEGGHRVPFIAWWPGKIDQGIESSEITMTMDLYPTFAKLAGAELSYDLPLDGLNLNSLLFMNEKLPDRMLFWKMDDEIAIRKGPWKLVKIGDQPFELYNLDQDLVENKNLADEQVEIVENLWDKYLIWEKDVKLSALKWKD